MRARVANVMAWLPLLAACGVDAAAPGPEQPPPPPPAPQPLAPLPMPSPPDADTLLSCFAPPMRVPVDNNVSFIATEDFDRDGRTDVLAIYETYDGREFHGKLHVFRNTGDGRLEPGPIADAGSMAYHVSIADLDGDGIADLAANDPRGKQVLLYAGRGDGSFTRRGAVATGRTGYSGTLADLDGDMRLDLVVELLRGVQIHRGAGDFRFRAPTTIATDQAPDGPAIADFDGDGDLDLGYAANDNSHFFTLRGDGRGRFSRADRTASCPAPAYTIAADVDDDGDTDIVYDCTDTIDMRLNDGRGHWRAASLPYGHAETSVVAAELTGDGRTDLLLTLRPTTWTGQLVLLRGEAGGFRELTSASLDHVTATRAADLDGDLRDDIVFATWSGRAAELVVLLARDCGTRIASAR